MMESIQNRLARADAQLPKTGIITKADEKEVLELNCPVLTYQYSITCPDPDIDKCLSVMLHWGGDYLRFFCQAHLSDRVLDDEVLNSLINKIIVDSESALWFAKTIKGVNIDYCEQYIDNSKHALDFACDVEGADIEKMQQIIVNEWDAESAFSFASNVPGADIEKMQEIQRGLEGWSLDFAKMIPGTNLSKMTKDLIEFADSDELLFFALDDDLDLSIADFTTIIDHVDPESLSEHLDEYGEIDNPEKNKIISDKLDDRALK